MKRLLSFAVVLLPLVTFSRWVRAQGVPMGAEFRVPTYTSGTQGTASVTLSATGDFIVLWGSDGQEGSQSGAYAQRYASSGSQLGSEFRVNTYTTGGQFHNVAAFDTAGNFVVVWHSLNEDGSLYGIFGQRYSSAGTPAGAEFQVNTYTTGSQDHPVVVSGTAGGFVVAWQSAGQDGAGFSIIGRRYASSGAPLGGEFQINSYTTGSQGLPRVASDSSGNFVVVWQSDTQDGSTYGIFGQRYASTGVPSGNEFQVNTYTTGYQRFPSVASDSSGNFVVVWQSYTQDGSTFGIFGQRYASTGAPSGNEFQVNTYTTGSQGFPGVASDSSGNFVVVWVSDGQDGSYGGVFGQRYASSGAPAGAEFRVNTYTTNAQFTPAVSADPAGNFVVVWESYLQGPYLLSVFGQRYGKILPVDLTRFTAE
jgi:large repetitive protein